MKIHILGICGTFMAGIATLAKAMGHEVQGCDANVYPPMSTQLEEQGIKLTEGFDPAQFAYKPDYVVIGNAMSRGNPAVEYVLNEGLPYTSGPQWLAEHVMQGRHVIAISGTHGKTTTSSLMAWALEVAGLTPGFLIGGVPENFGVSARLGDAPYFVIEADEYDSGFFDKRSKFIHYHPRTLVMNNLEFDHADIFPNLAAIQTQFQFLVRTVPSEGSIVWPADDHNLAEVMEKGCWSEQILIGPDSWRAEMTNADGSEFAVFFGDKKIIDVSWGLLGKHNVKNALVVFAVATKLGIKADVTAQALASFENVKRRLEVKGTANNITVYDDFAHHPTAIELTLDGLRNKIGKQQRIIAVVELGSYTMRVGVHKDHLLPSLEQADEIIFYKPEKFDWQLGGQTTKEWCMLTTADEVLNKIVERAKPGDHILIMSNRGFAGIHQRILTAVGAKKYG
jgi:UDP-N-acetylmuramate: L-alanyl-gamma-D-glutamyl-meso-diaminopimelate ligase